MDPHSIVIVSLHTPKEKVWGELLAINPSGITLRGIDLNSFDHFIHGAEDLCALVWLRAKRNEGPKHARLVHCATCIPVLGMRLSRRN